MCVSVYVNSFTALAPVHFPSPLFITATEVIPAPHSLPKLLPHRWPIAALRVRWECSIAGHWRGDVPASSSSAWVRPRVLYHRGEASEITARSLRVSAAVCLREEAGMSCRDSLTPTPEGQVHRNTANSHFRFQNKAMAFVTNYRSSIYPQYTFGQEPQNSHLQILITITKTRILYLGFLKPFSRENQWFNWILNWNIEFSCNGVSVGKTTIITRQFLKIGSTKHIFVRL